MDECLRDLTSSGRTPLLAVINTAAVSQPAACERDEAAAAAVNVPTQLLDALQRHRQEHGAEPILIHISTDQVRGMGFAACARKLFLLFGMVVKKHELWDVGRVWQRAR